eukprot:1329742-Pyramimonas_sp.AAC.2
MEASDTQRDDGIEVVSHQFSSFVAPNFLAICRFSIRSWHSIHVRVECGILSRLPLTRRFATF